MTLTPANAKKMLFTLRYPPDKILEVYEGSFTANASGSAGSPERTHEPIDHPFGTFVLPNTTYSTDGGSTWQDENVVVPNLSVPTSPNFQTLEVSAYSTTTQVIVVASNYTTSNITVTYRVVALSRD